jgi:hypothetical protein
MNSPRYEEVIFIRTPETARPDPHAQQRDVTIWMGAYACPPFGWHYKQR